MSKSKRLKIYSGLHSTKKPNLYQRLMELAVELQDEREKRKILEAKLKNKSWRYASAKAATV